MHLQYEWSWLQTTALGLAQLCFTHCVADRLVDWFTHCIMADMLVGFGSFAAQSRLTPTAW